MKIGKPSRASHSGGGKTMRSPRHAKRRVGLAAALVLALIFAACGPSGTGSGGSSSTPNTVVTIAQGTGPASMDPLLDSTLAMQAIYQTIYEGLTATDGRGKVLPLLAESWSSINDTTTQFKLRKGIKFSNGEPFDAATVEFTVKRMQDPKVNSTKLSILSDVVRVDTIDPYTINIITKALSPFLLVNLSQLYLVPPKYTAEKTADAALNPIGTGPYKQTEYVRDERVVVEARADYWGTKPKVQKIIWRTIPEASTRIAALQAGDVDMISNVPADSIQTLKSAGLNIASSGAGLGMILHLNTLTKGPLQDVRVRQALNYAVDKESIVKNVLLGYGKVLDGQLPTADTFGHNPNLKAFPYDPAKAKQLLADAGYPNGIDLQFAASSGRYLKDKETAEAIVSEMGTAGIRAKLTLQEAGAFFSKARSGNCCDMFMIGWFSSPQFDADKVLPWFAATSPYSYYRNPDYDKLLNDAKATTDQAKRQILYNQATQIMYDQAAGVFLFEEDVIYAVGKNLKNWKPRPDDIIRYADLGGS